MEKNLFNLSGKVCVVIGAGLVGSEFAQRLASQGATVVIGDLNTETGQALAESLRAAGAEAPFFSCDARNEESIKTFAAEVFKKYGRVDGVVNSVYPRSETWGKALEDLSYEEFVEHVGLHMAPQFITAREFGVLMKKQGSGSIVLIGSIYGVHAPRFELYEGSEIQSPRVEYAIAKGGLGMLTRYLAKYWGPSGVRVNMISPGGIWDNQDKAFEEKFNTHAVLGARMAHPGDISPALVYLFSDASAYVTGQNIVLDGGWTL